MDSKDKLINDLRKQVQVLQSAVLPREAQIDLLRNNLTEIQSKLIGVDAVRNSLQNERELTIQLSNRINTLQNTVEALMAENDHLKKLNLNLQTQNNERTNQGNTGGGETANEKTA